MKIRLGLQTEGKSGEKVAWSNLKIAASVVVANQKGVLCLPRDPRVSDGKVPHRALAQLQRWMTRQFENSTVVDEHFSGFGREMVMPAADPALVGNAKPVRMQPAWR